MKSTLMLLCVIGSPLFAEELDFIAKVQFEIGESSFTVDVGTREAFSLSTLNGDEIYEIRLLPTEDDSHTGDHRDLFRRSGANRDHRDNGRGLYL